MSGRRVECLALADLRLERLTRASTNPSLFELFFFSVSNIHFFTRRAAHIPVKGISTSEEGMKTHCCLWKSDEDGGTGLATGDQKRSAIARSVSKARNPGFTIKEQPSEIN